MEHIKHFETKQECETFLNDYDFKYRVPNYDNSNGQYTVELTKDLKKVVWCAFEFIGSGHIYDTQEFYNRDNMSYKDDDGNWHCRFALK